MKEERQRTYPIPADWRSRPELLPALRLLVEGARRAEQKRQSRQDE